MILDDELISACKNGDDLAFSGLVELYIQRAYAFAFRYLRREEDAEDAVQEAFLRAWKHLPKFDVSKDFQTWFFKILKNVCVDSLRKKQPVVFSELENGEGNDDIIENIPDPAPLPPELMHDRARGEILEKALGRLNPNDRMILVLHYGDNLTFEKIAEIMSIPMNTIKSRHRRALFRLRREMHQK